MITADCDEISVPAVVSPNTIQFGEGPFNGYVMLVGKRTCYNGESHAGTSEQPS